MVIERDEQSRLCRYCAQPDSFICLMYGISTLVVSGAIVYFSTTRGIEHRKRLGNEGPAARNGRFGTALDIRSV